MRWKTLQAGGVILGPPRLVAGVQMRAVCRTQVRATPLPGGLWADANCVPLAILVGAGASARLFGLDGRPYDATDLGVSLPVVAGAAGTGADVPRP